MSGALGGGGRGVALATWHHGLKVEVDAVSVHEVTVDDVVHVTVQVLGEHVYVQVRGQPLLLAREAGRAAELGHGRQGEAGVCQGEGPAVVGAHHCWH